MSRTTTDSKVDLDRQVRSAIDAFASRFGRLPAYAATAPGRVNLIGEHTDYNQGFVLPMAIDRQTLVLADVASANQSTLFSIDLDETTVVDLTSAPLSPMPGRAANYMLGVVQQFAELGHFIANLDVLVTSTVPVGAGLSSSAALEVGFATMLEQVIGCELKPIEKALLCQRAEHEFPGTPVGIMDVLISAGAMAGHAMLIDCRSNTTQPVPLPPTDQAKILIVDTKVKHELSGGEYANRRAVCESAAKAMNVQSLRDANLPMLNRSGLSPDEHKRALHVITENARTVLAAEALASRNLRRFGELMFASHDSLRDLFEVSCDELNNIVNAAKAIETRGDGVYGARMTGGGFGGCAVVLCEARSVDSTGREIEDRFHREFGKSCATFVARPAAGARALRL